MLLAIKLFGRKTDVIASGEEAVVDYSEVIFNIFLKFIDVLEAVLIIIVGFFVMRLARRYFQRVETAHERQRTALNLLEKITSGFIIVITITLALKVVGLDLTLIVSVLTLGLSFGLRDIIKNYVAGVLILFKSPFEIGDIVKIRHFTGRIIKIEFQSVSIRTFDNTDITIYNKDVLTQPITNFTRNNQRRLQIKVTLGYGSDIARALKIIAAVIEADSHVLKEPRYSIIFGSFGNTGTGLRIRFWVQRPCNILKIQSELAFNIQAALDEEYLYAPYTREVDGTFTMNENRKARLAAFYGQSALAAIAAQVATVTAAITGNGQAIAAVPAEESPEAEEPE